MTGLSNSRREGPGRPGGFPAAVAGRRSRWDVEFAERIISIERTDVFEIPARAKRAARAVEHRDRSILISIKFKKGGCQRIRTHGVHCVTRFGSIVDHCPYRSVFFNSDCHIGLPFYDES